MKINISNSQTGQQKVVTVEDEHKVMNYYEKRMGMTVDGKWLGEEFDGMSFKITGGNDKQGFPMMQGVLKNSRVRLLFSKGMACYRERRAGMRKRKSVRGCIVGPDLAILNLCLEDANGKEVAGFTDGAGSRRKGPKRASKIAKVFDIKKGKNKTKEICSAVTAREIMSKKEGEEEKVKCVKRPKIQRLITPRRLRHKRFRKNQMIAKVQKSRDDRKAYAGKVHEYAAAQKAKRHADAAKKKKKTVKKSA